MERLFRFYYVYQITNKINGNIYVGVHATNDMDDGYMGSGLLVKRAIEKYGIENFVKAILFEGISYQELLDKEAEIVTTEFVNREDTYNLREGGNGSASLILEKELERRKNVAAANRRKQTGVPRSEETKRKLSESLQGRAPTNIGKLDPSLFDKKICPICGREFIPRYDYIRKRATKCCSRACVGRYTALNRKIYPSIGGTR